MMQFENTNTDDADANAFMNSFNSAVDSEEPEMDFESSLGNFGDDASDSEMADGFASILGTMNDPGSEESQALSGDLGTMLGALMGTMMQGYNVEFYSGKEVSVTFYGVTQSGTYKMYDHGNSMLLILTEGASIMGDEEVVSEDEPAIMLVDINAISSGSVEVTIADQDRAKAIGAYDYIISFYGGSGEEYGDFADEYSEEEEEMPVMVFKRM
jgi:hypothetical protein